MISGMTGFGRGSAQASRKGRVSVELKSINHRYFELIAHLPPNFNLFEERIRKEIQKYIKRGRVIYVLTFSHKSAPMVSLDAKLARRYFCQLKKLSKELGLRQHITPQLIASFDGVLRISGLQVPSEDLWPLVKQATAQAISRLIRARKAEGESIYRDICSKLHKAKELASAISKRRNSILRTKKRRLSLDEFRLFAKDHDINEELTRVNFHLRSFKRQLHKSGSIGKELDFIAQELQREINTIGAKLPDKKVSYCVIKIKSAIEQIREQLQNTE
jgi:uncharacterized protein (TIGR00255 family)